MTQPVAPAQLSPDGHWWWNGAEWVPADQRPAAEPAPAPAAVPAGLGAPYDYHVTVPSQTVVPASSGSYAPPAPSSGTDSLAITSLVLSLLWVFGLGSVGAVVTGHLSRSHAKREGREPSGLALAGLILGYVGAAFMVVGFLAAIAIPVFLNQRLRGVDAQVRSDLRNAATAEEVYYTDHGTYAGDVATLRSAGFTSAPGVEVEVLGAQARSYCLGARKDGRVFYYDGTTGRLSTVPCV